MNDELRMRISDGGAYIEKQPHARAQIELVLVAPAHDRTSAHEFQREPWPSRDRHPAIDESREIRMRQPPGDSAASAARGWGPRAGTSPARRRNRNRGGSV